jgi:hypothetical protein
MQTGVWKTKGGADIRICDMDNSHLVHTILFLERIAVSRDPNNWLEFVKPIYWCMLEEVDDRAKNGRLGGVGIVENRILLVSPKDAPLGIISAFRKREKTRSD